MDIHELKPVFIRHKLHLTEGSKTLEKFWNSGLIVLDYEPRSSTNPDDYEGNGAKIGISKLNKFCESGAIVGASYRDYRKSHILVGVLRPGSRIVVKSFDGYDYWKCVELSAPKEVSLLDYPSLLSLQPRQTAITHWPSAKKQLLSAYLGKSGDSVYFLDPGQLEVLCYEYLRSNLLSRLLLPIGRGLRDIDIFGLDEKGCKILAQVTFSASEGDIKAKSQSISQYLDSDVNIFFFAPESARQWILLNPKLKFIAVEDVFEAFKSERFLLRMLGQN